MNDRFHIRDATTDDAIGAASIYNRAREQAMPFLPVQTAERVAPKLRAAFTNETAFVAEDLGNRLVGFITFNEQFVTFLYVEPTVQGQGIGTALLERAMSGKTRVDVWTFQRNQAGRRFYERCGFVALEFTDGSGNDKGEGEVLYSWAVD